MKRTTVLMTAATLLLLLIGTPARAGDRVTLASGVVIDGNIIMEHPSLIVLELPDVGTIRIPRGDIAKIEKNVHQTGGSRVERPRNPEGEKRETHLLRYDDLLPGAEVLLILTGEDHDQWRTSGQRHFCRIEMKSDRRLKVTTNPEAGALGEVWVPRDSIDRIVDVKKFPDLRFMLFDGAQTGAWLRLSTADGSLISGRLEEVTENGKVTLAIPREGKLEKIGVDLGEIRSLQTISRKAPLELDLTSLAKGEPIALQIWGQPDPVIGTFNGMTDGFLDIETHPTGGGEAVTVKVFKDAPITAARRLPVEIRNLYGGVAHGDTITVRTTSEQDGNLVRRAITGNLIDIDFDQVTIQAGAEAEAIPHDRVSAVDIPEKSRLAALRGELDARQVKGVPKVLPGMSESEAKAVLPARHPGLDITFENGRVAKIACRAPWSGSPFNLPIGGSLASASVITELVFDTQIEPKEGGFTTVKSHSLKGLVVTLYVSADGKILGAEITPR